MEGGIVLDLSEERVRELGRGVESPDVACG